MSINRGHFSPNMSGIAPRLVANDAGAVAPNSLHILRFRTDLIDGRSLAGLWQTSLTALSAEIEGHSLGGGMLKLEPTEAEKILVPWPRVATSQLTELAGELDELARRSKPVGDRANEEVLQQQLGLSRSDCQLLSSAVDTLRERRLRKNGE